MHGGSQPADISLIHRRSRLRVASPRATGAECKILNTALEESDHISVLSRTLRPPPGRRGTCVSQGEGAARRLPGRHWRHLGRGRRPDVRPRRGGDHIRSRLWDLGWRKHIGSGLSGRGQWHGVRGRGGVHLCKGLLLRPETGKRCARPPPSRFGSRCPDGSKAPPGTAPAAPHGLTTSGDRPCPNPADSRIPRPMKVASAPPRRRSRADRPEAVRPPRRRPSRRPRRRARPHGRKAARAEPLGAPADAVDITGRGRASPRRQGPLGRQGRG